MAKQGRAFERGEVMRILSLLSNTEMTIAEIAKRMDCSRSGVASINRRFQVRGYDGLRKTYTNSDGQVVDQTNPFYEPKKKPT